MSSYTCSMFANVFDICKTTMLSMLCSIGVPVLASKAVSLPKATSSATCPTSVLLPILSSVSADVVPCIDSSPSLLDVDESIDLGTAAEPSPSALSPVSVDVSQEFEQSAEWLQGDEPSFDLTFFTVRDRSRRSSFSISPSFSFLELFPDIETAPSASCSALEVLDTPVRDASMDVMALDLSPSTIAIMNDFPSFISESLSSSLELSSNIDYIPRDTSTHDILSNLSSSTATTNSRFPSFISPSSSGSFSDSLDITLRVIPGPK